VTIFLPASSGTNPPFGLERARRDWIDRARGFGILLVVSGHALRGLRTAKLLADSGAIRVLDRAIYSFHMALFFCVAGMFLIPNDCRSHARVAARHVVRLGYPYMIWASLQMLMQVALSRHTNTHARLADLRLLACVPPMQFWFLYVLLLHALAACLLLQLGVSRGGMLALAGALLIAAPYVSLGSWGVLYQVRSYFFFTTLGIWLGTRSRLDALERISRPVYAAITVLGFAAVIASAVLATDPGRLHAFAIACAGTAAVIGMASCWPQPSAAKAARVLASWGRASLAIFVAHTMASACVRIVLQKLLHVADPGVHLVLGVIAGMAGPLVLWWASRKLGLPWLFEWRPPLRRTPAIAVGRA
jgi:fucose 4-O-acetylase-like acetyltransferase